MQTLGFFAALGLLASVPNGPEPVGSIDPAKPIPLNIDGARPRGAPNILVVLLDDVGFGADSTFGGPVPTPNLDALAAGGLRYNRFHTPAMCSPTRAALLTGRNHHRVEMGSIVNLAVGNPGHTSVIPDSAATIADILGQHGYTSAWFGKNHVTPLWEQSAIGPFDRWPTGLGFDHFYGFMDGASDQFHPILIENINTIDPSAGDPNYILDRDLVDHTANWISSVENADPNKPWMVYLAPGTAHEPHQAPAEWLAKFRGKFDHGWDVERQRIIARQKALGIVPPNTDVTERPDLIPAWGSLSDKEREVASRLMEAFAAQRAHFDFEFGRLVNLLKAKGEWDNTLVIFIDGDNGSSGEGGLNGSMLGLLNRPAETTEYQHRHVDRIGGPFGGGNYNVGWGWALDAPFPWFKQHASHLGGTRAGMVVSWPKHIREGGAIRTQYAHVNDIAPTIYDAVGIVPPKVFGGVEQLPIDGRSLLASLAEGEADTGHDVQYYEMLGNVGIYKDGWLANIAPPNIMFAPEYGKDKRWELYHLPTDFAQSRNVARQHPEKLAELQAEWKRQQAENGFVALEGFIPARANPTLRPDPFRDVRSLTFSASDAPIRDGAFPDLNNRSWALTVQVTVGPDAAGTIISQGGFPYGWGLYVIDGKFTAIYVNEPEPVMRLQLPIKVPPGKNMVELRMTALEGGKPGGSAIVTLKADHAEPVSYKLAKTVPMFWGANGVGIGREVGTAMLPGLGRPFEFTGEIGEIKLSLE